MSDFDLGAPAANGNGRGPVGRDVIDEILGVEEVQAAPPQTEERPEGGERPRDDKGRFVSEGGEPEAEPQQAVEAAPEVPAQPTVDPNAAEVERMRALLEQQQEQQKMLYELLQRQNQPQAQAKATPERPQAPKPPANRNDIDEMQAYYEARLEYQDALSAWQADRFSEQISSLSQAFEEQKRQSQLTEAERQFDSRLDAAGLTAEQRQLFREELRSGALSSDESAWIAAFRARHGYDAPTKTPAPPARRQAPTQQRQAPPVPPAAAVSQGSAPAPTSSDEAMAFVERLNDRLLSKQLNF